MGDKEGKKEKEVFRLLAAAVASCDEWTPLLGTGIKKRWPNSMGWHSVTIGTVPIIDRLTHVRTHARMTQVTRGARTHNDAKAKQGVTNLTVSANTNQKMGIRLIRGKLTGPGQTLLH